MSLGDGAGNLALDEALLESAEAGQSGPVLRFWEAPSYFVALGYTNHAAIEADLPLCAARGVTVLRRCSGGGTVLQGPGCLNYALIHPIEAGQMLNVGATNALVMETNRAALQDVLGFAIELAGQTDMAFGGRKFSGNAQKRKARFFLFHGTLLLDFDLDLVQSLLLPPPKQPEYRARRSHRDFICNLPVTREHVKLALGKAWGATQESQSWPRDLTRKLAEEKYRCDEWNFKF